MKKLLKKILNPYDLYAPFLLIREGALFRDGWFRSYREGKPVDYDGNPLPWVTYPYIDFMTHKLDNSFHLFEFGTGNSTLWYAKRVKKVVAVEHDDAWFKSVRSQIPENVRLIYTALEYGGEYSMTAARQEELYDIIIVDGRDRVNCIIRSINALTDRGILILDDSERTEYAEGTTWLRKNGFRQLDFWGMAPGLLYKKCTSIFYRDHNCLGI